MEVSQHHFLSLFFRGGSLISFGRSVRKPLEHILDLGTWPTYFLAPTTQYPSVTALFSVSICSEGLQVVWRVRSSVLGSNFHLEDPLEEV